MNFKTPREAQLVYQSSDRNKFLSIKPLNIARLFLSLPRTIKVGFCYGCQSMGSRYYLKFLVYSLFSFTHFKAQSCRKKFFCIQYIWKIYLWFWGCNPQISTKFCKTLSLNSSEILLCRRQLRETRGSNRLRWRLSVFSVWCFNP
jgi:hypothetical protein